MWCDISIVIDASIDGWLATARKALERRQEVDLVNFAPQFYLKVCNTMASLHSFDFQADEFHRSGSFRSQDV
jgi:hypothetical protein